MQDVQKVPSAKADGNILSQEIKKTVNLFHNNPLTGVPSLGVVSRLRRVKNKAPAL
jgi:hypothetical protein